MSQQPHVFISLQRGFDSLDEKVYATWTVERRVPLNYILRYVIFEERGQTSNCVAIFIRN